ncbi:MAG TPA: CehA/McbA family metallohydrolase [Myxococcota bacterium]|nr:CehA/McbA family metallohydrolase [Myxococcota bacterium]
MERRRAGGGSRGARALGLVALLGALGAWMSSSSSSVTMPAVTPAGADADLDTSELVPPRPLVARRGVPGWLLYSVLADGRLAGHYAVDGHLHSEVSGDSHTSVREIAALAEKKDLDAIVITDHGSVAAGEILAALDRTRAPGARPLFILGEEAGAIGAHVGLWNVAHHSRFDPHDRGDRILSVLHVAAAHNPAALAVLNHPGWSGVGPAYFHPAFFDPRLPGPKFDAIELWNGRFLLQHQTRRLIAGWEEMLERGLRPSILACSDAHHGSQVGSPFTVVISPALDAASITESARAGRTYLSDDARVAFSVDGVLPGETLEADASTDPWHVRLAGWSARGGTLRLYDRRTVVLETELVPGPFDLGLDYAPPAPARDGWLRVEIVRRQKWKGTDIDFVGLITSPVYYDLAPYGDFWAARPGTWREAKVVAAVTR